MFVLELVSSFSPNINYDKVRVYDGSMGEWANREDTPLIK